MDVAKLLDEGKPLWMIEKELEFTDQTKDIKMATQDVPGANVANNDELHVGCWAEHDDGSLLLVKGIEGINPTYIADTRNVIYELYDLQTDPPVSYTDAMRKEAFERQYSRPPTGTSDDVWSWHDKTSFPWDTVKACFRAPSPGAAFADDQLSAAARVAESLRLRAERVAEEDVDVRVPQERPRRGVMDRLLSAIKSGVAAFEE